MKFALVYTDVNRIVNEPGNKTVMKHFGHMPNIQLLYVAAVLEKLDVEVLFLDVIAMRLDNLSVEKKLKEFQPDVIGLSVYTTHFHHAINYCKYLKSFLLNTEIMLGGVHTSIYPLETMTYNSFIDYVCVGEAEVVLPEFIRHYKYDHDFSGIKGLIWRDGENIKYAGPAELANDLDATPFPARHLIPNDQYYNFISTKKNYTVFNTSRGCPFRCLFCEAGGTKWRARTAKNVVDEFEE